MFSFGGTSGGNAQSAMQPSQNNQQSLFQQQQMQAQQSTSVPIERLTRVSDLPGDAQNLIEQLQRHINDQISISEQFALDTRMQEVESVVADVAEVQQRWTRTQSTLVNDQRSLETLRDQVHMDDSNARISTRFIDGVRSGSLNPRSSADQILKYFCDTIDSVETELQAYAGIIIAIEKHLNDVRTNELVQDSSTLIATLQGQHRAFLAISSKVAEVHDRATQVLR